MKAVIILGTKIDIQKFLEIENMDDFVYISYIVNPLIPLRDFRFSYTSRRTGLDFPSKETFTCPTNRRNMVIGIKSLLKLKYDLFSEYSNMMVYIGVSPFDIGDNETGKEFRLRVYDSIKEVLNSDFEFKEIGELVSYYEN